ncbi:hypothetical protein ACFSC4_22275 [Deinococcus malanensis]|uniref:hypothetical protein n=1 Tax=Deinococcus malanensis TaxID=1706855 RepID=UPI0036266238
MSPEGLVDVAGFEVTPGEDGARNGVVADGLNHHIGEVLRTFLVLSSDHVHGSSITA